MLSRSGSSSRCRKVLDIDALLGRLAHDCDHSKPKTGRNDPKSAGKVWEAVTRALGARDATYALHLISTASFGSSTELTMPTACTYRLEASIFGQQAVNG